MRAIRIDIAARYDAEPDAVFEAARGLDALAKALKGVAVYRGLAPGTVLEAGGVYVTDIWFWGLLPTYGHTIRVTTCDPEGRVLETSESHRGIRQWDCRSHVTAEPEGGALWSETIIIDAGRQTPLVGRFAAYTYRMRHRRGIPVDGPERLQPARTVRMRISWPQAGPAPG